MSRPTAPTDWADAAGANRSTVPTAIRDLGVPVGDVFRSGYYNEALHDIGLWLGYLATASPADLTWKIGRIITGNDPLSAFGLTITDEGGATGGVNVVVTQAGEIAQFGTNDGAGAIGSVRFTRNAGVALARADGGWFWNSTTAQRGVRALPDLTSLLVYEIQAGQNIEIGVGPNLGGYTLYALAGMNIVQDSDTSFVAFLNLTGSTASPSANRPIDSVFGTSADSTTVRYKAVSLTSEWLATVRTAAAVELVSRARFGPDSGEVVHLTVTRTAPTDTPGTAIDLNPTTRIYWMRFKCTSLANTDFSDSVADVILKLKRFEA